MQTGCACCFQPLDPMGSVIHHWVDEHGETIFVCHTCYINAQEQFIHEGTINMLKDFIK